MLYSKEGLKGLFSLFSHDLKLSSSISPHNETSFISVKTTWLSRDLKIMNLGFPASITESLTINLCSNARRAGIYWSVHYVSVQSRPGTGWTPRRYSVHMSVCHLKRQLSRLQLYSRCNQSEPDPVVNYITAQLQGLGDSTEMMTERRRPAGLWVNYFVITRKQNGDNDKNNLLWWENRPNKKIKIKIDLHGIHVLL